MDASAQLLNRMDRMEKHLDEMRLALVQMARTEERVSTVLEQNAVLFKKVDALTERVRELEQADIRQVHSLGFIAKVAWMLGGGVVTVIVSVVNGLLK